MVGIRSASCLSTALFAIACCGALSSSGCSGGDQLSPPDAAPDAMGCVPGLPPAGVKGLVTSAPTFDTVGLETVIALDENGAPIVGYTTTSTTAVALWIVRWDYACQKWMAPMKVDSFVDNGSNPGVREVAIAYDTKSSSIVIAYSTLTGGPRGSADDNQLRLAIIGKNASAPTIATVTQFKSLTREIIAVSLAVASGQVHLAYVETNDPLPGCAQGGCDAVLYTTGPVGGALPAGQKVSAALNALHLVTGIAVDSSGNPAIAFLAAAPPGAGPPASYNTTAMYVRPGKAPVKVIDSLNVQNDNPSIDLAFDGLEPRIVTQLKRKSGDPFTLWYSGSTDGVVWPAPLRIVKDGDEDFGIYTSISVAPDHHIAIISPGSGGSTNKCGQPKIAQSLDGKTFATCGTDLKLGGLDNFAAYARGVVGPDNKVQLTYQADGSAPAIAPAGVYYYHEK